MRIPILTPEFVSLDTGIGSPKAWITTPGRRVQAVLMEFVWPRAVKGR